MSDQNGVCPHCKHEWAAHKEYTSTPRCFCGCMWTLPKPPPQPPTERELFTLRIARILYDGIRESCDGYVESFEQYGDTEPSDEVVDGRVNFDVFANYVITALKLEPPQWSPSGLDEFHPDTTHNPEEKQ